MGQHTHAYTRSKPSAGVETCSCGKWRFTEHAGPAIVEQPAAHLHLCAQCQKDMGNEWILGPVCGKCCRANHRKVVGR